jgi:hypothetical protein
MFVSNLRGHEFVDFKILDPAGNEVSWQGGERTAPREYSSSDFAVLASYHEVSAKRTISVKDGAGFVFDKIGEYSVIAEYSLGPLEDVAPFAGETEIPTGSFRYKTKFCIEACIREPVPVHDNTSREALAAVVVFYSHITKYKPLGIPTGPARKALWPLLSKRLASELDTFQACDDDYYRRYGDVDKANHYKPATPWLEDGLFSGSEEEADPTKFSILDSKAIGENRVDVHLRFTVQWADKSETDLRYEGLVTVILEHNRWIVDDFVPMGQNDDLHRLSDGFPECEDGHWVGEKPY